METKGDGSYTHGNSFANGPVPAFWARDWEYQQARAISTTFWDLLG